MSETERHVGKVKSIGSDKQIIEDWCKSKCEKLNIVLGDYEDYKSALMAEVYPAVAIEIDGEMWEVFDDEEEGDEYFSIFTPASDGEYNYVLQFYNGGTCLKEMLEEGIQKLKEENL